MSSQADVEMLRLFMATAFFSAVGSFVFALSTMCLRATMYAWNSQNGRYGNTTMFDYSAGKDGFFLRILGVSAFAGIFSLCVLYYA